MGNHACELLRFFGSEDGALLVNILALAGRLSSTPARHAAIEVVHMFLGKFLVREKSRNVRNRVNWIR